MRYLFIAFLFVSLFGHSQGIEPSSFQGNPNKSGFLKSVTLNVDDFGDTTYLYVHVDSLGIADSIYLRGDSLILLKNGSGQVYKNRIYTGLFSAYDVPNPQKYDIYVNADQTSYWWNGSDWVLFDGDTNPYNEGELTLHDIDPNVVGMRSSTNYFNVKNFVGLNGIQITTNELDSLNIGIDTTLFADETQYLNPYVVTGDTTGFYLTVAQDTVLFVNTIDTSAYCCPPSLSGDTLYIEDNYVVLPVANIIGGWGIDATESPANTWNLIADSSQVATQYDISGFVSGSGVATRLAFWSGTSSLSSNANLYWDNTNSRLGIGTASPTYDLHVAGSTGNNSIFLGDTNKNIGFSVDGPFYGQRMSTDYPAGWARSMNSYYNLSTKQLELGAYGSGATLTYGYIAAQTLDYSNPNLRFYPSGKTTAGLVTAGTAWETGKFNVGGSMMLFSGYNQIIGYNAGNATFNASTAYYNDIIGYNAGSGASATGNYSQYLGYNAGLNNTGTNNIIIGRDAAYNNTGSNSVFLGAYAGYNNTTQSALYIENTTSSTPLIGGDFSTDKVGINTAIGSISRTLHVGGEVRITDLTTDTPTKIVGADADGDLAAITIGYGLSFATDTLKADTTSANGLATQYDLTQISGSSKAIDRLASDFATTATSLQTTNIDYTFPSTGLYHVVLLANFQTTNTNGGIKAAYAASGGLAYDFISGAHRAPIDIYDATTERVSSLETLTSGINTTGVNPSGTPHHLQSDMLINVTTAGTVTLTFASESGSYTATLKAGSTLIIEKLN